MVDKQATQEKKGPEKNRHPNKPGQQGSSLLDAFQTHQLALRRFIARFIYSPQDVDDIAQEAFLRAYQSGKTREIDQPKSYLFRIAKNLAFDQLRQRSRKPTDYLGDFDDPDVLITDHSLEDEIMAQQKLSIHCDAVATLPEKCRRVYLMRKVYGLPYKTIAQELGISVNTVEAHMTKAYARCDDYIKKQMRDQPSSSKRSPANSPAVEYRSVQPARHRQR